VDHRLLYLGFKGFLYLYSFSGPLGSFRKRRERGEYRVLYDGDRLYSSGNMLVFFGKSRLNDPACDKICV